MMLFLSIFTFINFLAQGSSFSFFLEHKKRQERNYKETNKIFQKHFCFIDYTIFLKENFQFKKLMIFGFHTFIQLIFFGGFLSYLIIEYDTIDLIILVVFIILNIIISISSLILLVFLWKKWFSLKRKELLESKVPLIQFKFELNEAILYETLNFTFSNLYMNRNTSFKVRRFLKKIQKAVKEEELDIIFINFFIDFNAFEFFDLIMKTENVIKINNKNIKNEDFFDLLVIWSSSIYKKRLSELENIKE